MTDQFVAEIRMFGFNFPPTGWAFCDGQLLPLSQNTALFSLLGTFYGGDGQSTFALPDLQGSAPMHQGQGPGLTERFIGEVSGSATTTLLQSEIPVHAHNMMAVSEIGEDRIAAGEAMAISTGGAMYAPPNNLTQMAPQALPPAGSGFPHNNMMPFLVLNFCVALQGILPTRP